MQHHGRVEKHGRERLHGARIEDAGVVGSRRYAKSILLQAYLECLDTVCHSKQRCSGSAPRMQTKIVKMLTAKTKISDCDDAHEFCLELWDELSSSLVETQDADAALPTREELAQMQGRNTMIRLALLADFYRYQKEDLSLNVDESADKLCAVRAEAVGFLTKVGLPHSPHNQSSSVQAQPGFTAEPATSSRGSVNQPQSNHPPCTDNSSAGDSPLQPKHCLGEHLSDPFLHEAAAPTSPQSSVAVTEGPSANEVYKRRNLKLVPKRGKRELQRKKKTLKNNAVGGTSSGSGEDSTRWSKFCFLAKRRSYWAKLTRAFQAVKTIGYPMLTLNSEWGLSVYYKLAVAYTTDRPLELAAACLPELRQVVDMVHGEHFQKLSKLRPDCQMLLYAVLNCHINWVDYNHKQILLVPGQPSAQWPPLPPHPPPPRTEGDLRCSRCLKNQTFHSSEVNGNPRNIHVQFDFEQMKFGSSCCSAPVFNVPLCTEAVNTCTFTEMKQMYSSCPTCKQPIFSEVLVDMETLFSRCVSCARRGL